MIKKKSVPIQLLFTLILGMLLYSSYLLNISFKTPSLELSKEITSLNFNTQVYQFFHLGQKRLITDYLWIITLLESDLEKYNHENKRSWLFHRFKSISILDPRFYENYIFGSQYLSIIKEDLIGASFLFEKGIKQYPNDYHLNFYAGVHYYFGLGDLEKGLLYYENILHHPKTPYWFPSLLAKLKAEKGNLETSFRLVYELFEKTPKESPLWDKYYNSLYAIKAEIDLNCLSSKSENCDKNDFDGNAYIFNDGRFKAKKKWKLFRPSKNSSKN